MSELESAIVGYITGAIVGGLFFIFLIGYILWEDGSFTPPDWYMDLHSSIKTEYHQPNQTLFEIAFIFGFMSGLGGGGTAANSANNQRKQRK